jgi:hypothetical protein
MHPLRSLRILLIMATLFFSGCTFRSPLRGTMEQPPNVVKIPVTVGIYYSPEFSKYEHKEAMRGCCLNNPTPHTWVVPLGEASVKIFDQAFPLLFDNAVHVSRRPPFPDNAPKLDAVIEPEIEKYSIPLPVEAVGNYAATITYRFTLYSDKGTPLASWLTSGEGNQNHECFYSKSGLTTAGQATDAAIQDAVVKFMTGFTEVPGVRKWRHLPGAPTR